MNYAPFPSTRWSLVFSAKDGEVEASFDRAWARELFARSMAALETGWSHRAELFGDLRLTVESPESVEPYAEIASRHGTE